MYNIYTYIRGKHYESYNELKKCTEFRKHTNDWILHIRNKIYAGSTLTNSIQCSCFLKVFIGELPLVPYRQILTLGSKNRISENNLILLWFIANFKKIIMWLNE